jgi:hypothetical protein
MKKVRTMKMRPHALPCLIGALALALATGGKASADTCLLTNNWGFTGDSTQGSVDGGGTVTLTPFPGDTTAASQGPFAAQHPVLSGTVQNQDATHIQIVMILYGTANNWTGGVALESPQQLVDGFHQAIEARTWQPGTTSNFTLDANAILAQHFPDIDLSTVDRVAVFLTAKGGKVQFSNLCLTDVPPYTVAPLYDPNRAVKSGGVLPLKLQLRDASGANLSSPSLVVNATGLVQKDNQPDGTLTEAGNANADYNFRYDATLQGYVFNMKTAGLASGTWCLTFTVNGQSDPNYQLIFNVK